MFQKLVGYALTQLFKAIDAEDVKNFIDAGLDKIEDKYPDNENVNNAIAWIRKILDIEDKKYGSDKET